MSGPADSRSQLRSGNRDCLYVEENAAGHVLSALDPVETAHIDQHIALCPPCRHLLQELSASVSFLAYSSRPATPPARAKTRLLERIHAAPAPETMTADRFPPLPRTVTIPSSTPEITPIPASWQPQTGATLPSSTRFADARGSRRFNWELIAAPLAAVPLVLALAIVGGWAMRTQDRLQDQRAQMHDLEAANQEMTVQIELLSSGIGDTTRGYDLDAAGSAIGDSAGGRVLAATDDPIAALSVWNLPAAIDHYRVEVESADGRRHPAGEFTVDEQGDGRMSIEIDKPLDAYRALRILAAPTTSEGGATDSWNQHEVLWVDIDGNLGAPGGTEANAIAN